MRILLFLLLFTSSLLPYSGFRESGYALMAQTNSTLIDGPLTSLKDSPEKVDSLNKLCWEIEDNEQKIVASIQVLKLAENLGYKRGIARALNNIGVAFYMLSKGNESLEYHRKALLIREELGDKKDIAASFGNMGNTFQQLGDKKKAIEYHSKSLALKIEIDDSLGMASSYNNIASTYLDIPDYYKAVDNGFKAIKLLEKIGNRSEELAQTLNNLGYAYENLKEYDKGMSYYQKALALRKELGNSVEIARMMSNIANIYVLEGGESKDPLERKAKFMLGLDNYTHSLDILEGSDAKDLLANVSSNVGNIYWYLQDFPKALKFLNKSYEVYIALGSKSGIAFSLNNFSRHYQLQKQYDQSNKYAMQALSLADSIGDVEQTKNAAEYLSGNYYDLKQFEKSLFYFKKYVEGKDKLTNVEGAKKLAEEESRLEFEKKEQELKLQQEKQKAVAEAEQRRQEIITWAVGAGLLLVLVFSVFLYNRFRLTQKQNKIIEEQKREVDYKNRALEGANAEIAQKNKDITDSIQYAKRIQRALLASDTLLKKNLPEYFIFYKPKDIVSGDFYWAGSVDNKFLLITADCTGHGVPGAFMSLLNISLLNEITMQRKLTRPDLILNGVREQIISILNPEGVETESKDGMDCMLCTFDFRNNKLEFAAANNPLWVLKNGVKEIQEFKPDKQPVGFHSVYKPFTLQSASLEKGDIIYSFTDGFADQFGGPHGKKFKYLQLKEIILANAGLPMEEQQNILAKTFESWQGSLEQIDDVLVIGVKV